MKKIILTLAAGMMATAMMAEAVPVKGAAHLRHATATAAPSAYEGLEIVTQAPADGTVYTYTRNADIFYDEWGELNLGQDDGSCGEIVIAANGEDVYIKNPISTYVTDSYIVGKKEGNKIVCTFPQKLYHNLIPNFGVDEYYYIEVLRLVVAADGLSYAVAEEVDNTITYTINDDGTVTMEKFDIVPDTGGCPQFIMGMTMIDEETNSEGWIGFADWNQVYSEFTDSPVTLPEGLQMQPWAVTFWQELGKWNQDHTFFQVGFDNDDVYMAISYKDFPGAVIKGKLQTTADGQQIIFPSGQYLGVSRQTNHYAYFMGCGLDMQWNSEYEAYTPILYRDPKRDYLLFDYDAEAKAMYGDGWLVINQGNADIYWIYYYGEPTLEYQGTVSYAAPQDPTWVVGPTFDDGTGYWCAFIPKTDVNGNMMDTSKMYYNIFLDDQILYYTPEECQGLEDDMCDIPYDFQNDYDFRVNGELHQIPYYEAPDHRDVYIQSVLRGDDGQLYKSRPVMNPFMSNVEELESAKTVESICWYDLEGRKVSNPAKGIYIREIKFSDGSRKTGKTIIER